MNYKSPADTATGGRVAGIEFVAMMAALIALHALSIDVMLPALPHIGQDLGVGESNRLQWIITAYVAGMGLGQLACGPLSDRYGRRPVVLAGVIGFVAITLLTGAARSLEELLPLRALQGVTAAAAAVVPRAIVRDTHVGAGMSRVMSTILLVLMIGHVLAPSLGQVLLLIVGWREVFLGLALVAAVVGTWVATRLRETLAPEHRRPLSAANLAAAVRFVVTEPTSILYTVAIGGIYASLLMFISLLPQVLDDAFSRPGALGVVFAICGGSMGLASFLNSRYVERMGMQRISHTALLVFIGITALHTLVAWGGSEPLAAFVAFQSLTMACFALTVPNFGAIAMEPMAQIAGSAASLQGVISTVGGALIASLIGYHWSGAVVLLPASALGCGLMALACVRAAERLAIRRRLI